ncbi:hypothetical protein SBADM41S_08735 [Streptomyces badius]
MLPAERSVPRAVGVSGHPPVSKRISTLCIRFDALTTVTSGIAVVTAFVLRLLAMRFHWRAPRAWNRRSTVREGPAKATA